jgi:hypothetical protein
MPRSIIFDAFLGMTLALAPKIARLEAFDHSCGPEVLRAASSHIQI